MSPGAVIAAWFIGLLYAAVLACGVCLWRCARRDRKETERAVRELPETLRNAGPGNLVEMLEMLRKGLSGRGDGKG